MMLTYPLIGTSEAKHLKNMPIGLRWRSEAKLEAQQLSPDEKEQLQDNFQLVFGLMDTNR